MEETPTSELQSSNPDHSSSRLIGTNSLTKIYRDSTPGQSETINEPKRLREIIKKK